MFCEDLYFIDCVFFFFKQKTAYEMRISDWSSDVCSPDLCWKFGFSKGELVGPGRRMVENTEPLPPERASEDSASISGIGQSPVDQLLALLETEYVVLLTRLSAHVRSPDVAAEIIHDVYVKRSEEHTSELKSLMRISSAVFCLRKN